MRNHFEAKFILGALLASLSTAPAVLAQSQGQAQSSSQAATPAKSQGQSDAASAPSSTASSAANSAASQTKTQSASGNEPQMESQEAPPQESLGEAARRARAQRAAAPAAKIYTEDKVARLSGHGVSVVGDGNQAGESSDSENAENSEREPSAGGAAKANPASPQSGNSDEKMWREKARAIHDQMAQIDERISKIQEEIQKYGAVSFDPASGVRQNVIYMEDRNAQIKQLEEQKSKLQGQLDSLEEEGRKAGADSGWFR
jgi:hypothetical protein